MNLAALVRTVICCVVCLAVPGAGQVPFASTAPEPLEVRLTGRICTGDGSRIVPSGSAGISRASSAAALMGGGFENPCEAPISGARLQFSRGGEPVRFGIGGGDGSFDFGPLRFEQGTDCLSIVAWGIGSLDVCGPVKARRSGLGGGVNQVFVVLPAPDGDFFQASRGAPRGRGAPASDPWTIGGATLRSFLQDRVDEFEARTMDGSRLSLADMRGRVVYVEFWSTSCGPCIRDLPYLKKLYEALHPHGFQVVGVSQHPVDREADIRR